MPLLSIKTDDLGVLIRGADCGCEIAAPYLELKGRVNVKEIKLCLSDAAAFIKTKK